MMISEIKKRWRMRSKKNYCSLKFLINSKFFLPIFCVSLSMSWVEDENEELILKSAKKSFCENKWKVVRLLKRYVKLIMAAKWREFIKFHFKQVFAIF